VFCRNVSDEPVALVPKLNLVASAQTGERDENIVPAIEF